MKLEDKVIVITGGASGIGKATALKFAQEGAKVVLADINEVDGKDIVDYIKDKGNEAVFIKTDVTKENDVNNAVDFAVQKYERIDIMFNNAGIANSVTPMLDHDSNHYDKIVKINQYGVYYGIVAAAKKMKQLNIKGVIVNTSSAYGILPRKNAFCYNTAKAAVKMMTQSAALELADFGIRVVGIAPGYIDTPIIREYKNSSEGKDLRNRHMRKELLSEKGIVDAVYYLCSKEADIINGSTLRLDDGYTLFK